MQLLSITAVVLDVSEPSVMLWGFCDEPCNWAKSRLCEGEEAAQRVVYLITLLCFELCGILSSWNISASSGKKKEKRKKKKKKVHVPPASLLPAQHSSRTDCDSYFPTLLCPFHSTPGYSFRFSAPAPSLCFYSPACIYSCCDSRSRSFFSRSLKASWSPCSSIRHLILKCPVPPCHRQT